jgi:hypothetical protein
MGRNDETRYGDSDDFRLVARGRYRGGLSPHRDIKTAALLTAGFATTGSILSAVVRSSASVSQPLLAGGAALDVVDCAHAWHRSAIGWFVRRRIT